MFGSHLSIAGGMHHALIEAQRLEMTCVQVFTKNQRQWRVPPLRDEQVSAWREHMASTGITNVVSHDSYLINLASPKPEARDKSIALYRDEMQRCDALAIPHLVMHPGAHLGEGESAGLQRVIDAFDQLHDELPDASVITCLEITAGQGTTLGHRLEHLRTIIDGVQAGERLGVCLDTAHLLAAGYDLTTTRGAKAVLREVDDVVGLDRVHVLHLNDSKTPLGSRVDRHEHIGHGHIGIDGFKVFVNEPTFRDVPKILETAKEDSPDGRPWDVVNMETLLGLVSKRRAPARARSQGRLA
ncbi:deoxyribonuclease IV [Phycisphaerales bacterium AB-hyl4]|uniref:Probable endonuclease 4 n=1 Tax=Natronomicrosphaera hydrolytica TaxID=3242702 RepID=A0ABV4U4E3_9BACT